MGTLEGLLTFHEFWLQGSFLKSVILLFLLHLPLLKTLGPTSVIHMTALCHKMKAKVTFSSWLNDFAYYRYLEDCLMHECQTWYNGSVGHND